MQVASYFSVVGTRTSGPKLDLPNSIFGRKLRRQRRPQKHPFHLSSAAIVGRQWHSLIGGGMSLAVPQDQSPLIPSFAGSSPRLRRTDASSRETMSSSSLGSADVQANVATSSAPPGAIGQWSMVSNKSWLESFTRPPPISGYANLGSSWWWLSCWR